MSGPSHQPRRTFLRTAGLAGTGLLGLDSLSTAVSGSSPSEAGSSDTLPPAARWRTEMNVGSDCTLSAGEGTLYVASPGEAETITALEPDTGEIRWEVTDAVVERPVANGKWCFNCGSDLTALSRGDGTRAWTTSLPGKEITGLRLADETLYFGCPGGNTLYAIDAENGSERWAVDTNTCGLDLNVGWTTPTAIDDTLFAAVDRGLGGFDVADGSQQWHVDGQVYALCGAEDVAVSAYRETVRAVTCDGSVEWSREMPANVTRVVAVESTARGAGQRDGVVLVRLEGTTGRFRALSLTDGSPLWDFETGDHRTTMPAASDGTVYVGAGNGSLHAVDATTGDVEATFEASHTLHDRPGIVDGTVAVPSREGFVYGFEELS